MSSVWLADHPPGLVVSDGAANVIVGKVPMATKVMLAADPPDCSDPSIVPSVEAVIVPGVAKVSVQLLTSVAFNVTLVAAAGPAAATEMRAARPRKKRIGGLPI